MLKLITSTINTKYYISISIVILLLLYSVISQAKIYHCIENGKEIFQDKGCSINAQSSEIKGINVANTNELILSKDRDSHFRVSSTINNIQIEMLLDTGATKVTIPDEYAKKMNLPHLKEIEINTGNGISKGYITNITELIIANKFTLLNVEAIVAPNIDKKVILLGMNVLSKFKMIQDKNTLRLIYIP